MTNKKKENFWQLLERLDEQAGQFNQTISEANRYFDLTASKTRLILERQEKELHATIHKLKKALRVFREEENTGNGHKESGSDDRAS